MKIFITSCFLFFATYAIADDLTFLVKNTVKGDTSGSIDLSISGGTAPYQVNWQGPNGFIATTEDIDNLVAGTYSVTVTDRYCGMVTSTVVVKDFLTSIDELLAEQIIVFPNPTTTTVQISLPAGFKNYQFKIINAVGETMTEKMNLTSLQFSIDMNHFSSGVYIIEILQDNTLYRKKIMKN